MRQKVIPIIQKSSSSAKFDDENCQFRKKRSFNKKPASPKLEFSRESSFNCPQNHRTKRGGSFNTSGLYDDAIIEEPELKY